MGSLGAEAEVEIDIFRKARGSKTSARRHRGMVPYRGPVGIQYINYWWCSFIYGLLRMSRYKRVWNKTLFTQITSAGVKKITLTRLE